MKIHSCPFCGKDDYFIVKELERRDVAYNLGGYKMQNAMLEVVVECQGCGARGPSFVDRPGGDVPLTMAFEENAKNAAILSWNTRVGLNTKAFELVASIIDASLAALPSNKE